ncbi:peptidase inhibitor I9 [Nonomuraea polychroma]|uniref:Peptidase inhibitor I9 n=1 Tax=Nonomuraea polychroma TaxID=46176 RepID=A0A438MC93_9ACTN|nr:S8 family serine peptidase [Nonomuraea polychroma]RVX43211.1 peptidase inhibitor I9 [Nonomuraea polychroma]
MSRRLGLPSVYLAAAVATAATTAVPLAMTPASGLALRPAATEPAHPYIVIARGPAAARDLVGEVRWRVRRYYTAALPGFAAFLSAAELASLRADPRVRTIEPDRRLHAVPIRRLARPPAGPGTGTGATVYVVDSGVDAGRAEFGDRAWRAFDATGGAGRDCGGHGTQVAGRVHAAAPGAGIASVRVLDCGNSGTLADVLAGLDWIRRHARGPSVATLAVDGSGSPSLDAAVRSLVRSGVFVAGAADAARCRVEPGGAAYSALAPYSAGAAARYLERHPGTNPAILASRLNCTSTHDAIRQNPGRASNLLRHRGGL